MLRPIPRTGLETTYSYDGNGHVSAVTPPGENPWTFTYTHLGLEPASQGRLNSVSRTGPSGVETTGFEYQVPLDTGDGGPYDMTPATVANSSQRPPGDRDRGVPARHPALSHVLAVYRCDGLYLDSQDRLVNVAQTGGVGASTNDDITTTEYDTAGNVVRTLTAANRLRALNHESSATNVDVTSLGLTNGV